MTLATVTGGTYIERVNRANQQALWQLYVAEAEQRERVVWEYLGAVETEMQGEWRFWVPGHGRIIAQYLGSQENDDGME